MEQFRTALHSLTLKICRDLEGQEIPQRPIWTVVGPPDAQPHVAMDPSRPALSELHSSLALWLFSSPEYGAVADAVEVHPELREGIIVDAGGTLQKPERNNITRALVTNFLWRYLREGTQLSWDEIRFAEAFDELTTEVSRKSVVYHTRILLSNLEMEIDGLDFGDDLMLEPATIEELERWLNPDSVLPPFGLGRPQWDSYYVDRPAVLHARQTVIGRPPPTDLQAGLSQLPRVNVGPAVTALRLIMNAPISVIFQENDAEGLMSFGGHGTQWSGTLPRRGPLATLNSETAVQVINVWQILQTSPNIDILSLPIRQWESSLIRTSLEDSLIDAWISLEALLLGGENGELSFRASVRLAELLGTSGNDRQDIYDATRNSYKWRSIIVHGLRRGRFARQNPLRKTVQDTKDMLRSALLKILELRGPFVPADIESELLGRE